MKVKSMWLVVLTLFVFTAGFYESAHAASLIHWRSFQEGIVLGKNLNKKLFIYFTAGWCYFCLEMEKSTFKDPLIISALNENFIPVKVDLDREKETSSMFRVKGIPDTWFIAEDGEIIGHRSGYISADQLKVILNGLIADSDTQ